MWNLRKAGRRGVAAPTADRPEATGIPDKRTGFSPERGEPSAHGAQIKIGRRKQMEIKYAEHAEDYRIEKSMKKIEGMFEDAIREYRKD